MNTEFAPLLITEYIIMKRVDYKTKFIENVSVLLVYYFYYYYYHSIPKMFLLQRKIFSYSQL